VTSLREMLGVVGHLLDKVAHARTLLELELRLC
jgi:hypothetical protein